MSRKARARMLSSTISTSERVNALSLKSALIYTWLIPHCDDQGRIGSNPANIKGIVVPLRSDISVEEVSRALAEMEERGLVKTYEPEGFTWSPITELLQVLDWWDYQHLRDPQASKYPAPPGWRDKVGKQSRDERGKYRGED
jgi:hypothetical protein